MNQNAALYNMDVRLFKEKFKAAYNMQRCCFKE